MEDAAYTSEPSAKAKVEAIVERRKRTCSFTGHRNLGADEISYLKVRLEQTIEALIARGYQYFETGGALGFDTLAAESVLALRKVHRQVKLIVVIPCPTQTYRWRTSDVLRYEKILSLADEVFCISPQYTYSCMHMRNRRLVNDSTVCVAYLRASSVGSGGTSYTVDYAKRMGVRVLNLYPEGGARGDTQRGEERGRLY